MNYTREGKLNDKEKNQSTFGNVVEKIKENNLSNYLKEYLVDLDLNKNSIRNIIKEIKEEEENDDKNSVNLYNNESYLPYLINLINEKNKFIDELKSSIVCLKNKYLESESELKRQIEILRNNIKENEEKIKALSGDDKFEIIEYYEGEISKILKNYESFCNNIQSSIECYNTSIGLNEKKNHENNKNIINNLIAENSRLNTTVNKLKYLERMSKVYKSLIFRFGNKLELNQKIYDELFSKYSNVKNYIQNLEKDKKTLEETVNELNRMKQNSSEDNIINLRNKSQTEFIETTEKLKNLKGIEFIKIINQEKMVLVKYIDDYREIYSKIFKKIETLDNNLKFYFKKNINLMKEKLDVIEKDIKLFLSKCEYYYQYNTSVYNYMNELKSKIKYCKEKNDFTIIEDIIEKILNFFTNIK